MRWVPKSRAGWIVAGFASLVIVGLIIGAIMLAVRWPFTKASITRQLEEISASKVEIQSFRATYFPRPGCVAERVIFHHHQDASGKPFI